MCSNCSLFYVIENEENHKYICSSTFNEILKNIENILNIEDFEYKTPESATKFSDEDPQAHLEMVETIKEFYEFLGDETDIKIFKLYADGYTQKQIAEHLGFKTHSAVGKRLKKINEKRMAFLAMKLFE